jgi:Ca2+-binding EF-hand superfamily protein
LTERQVKELIASADVDNSGSIDFDELLALMENNTVR